MEQLLDDSVYIIDLGNINTTPEIIFELSSILEKDEVKNKRICLKLGNISLNQAQLLSIKSLINGIDSTLSSIDTKSVETEKVALSLGIIVSNVSPENTTEHAPSMPYKMAEEIKEQSQNTTIVENLQDEITDDTKIVENVKNESDDDRYNIVEEVEASSQTQQASSECKVDESDETINTKLNEQTSEINSDKEEKILNDKQDETKEDITSETVNNEDKAETITSDSEKKDDKEQPINTNNIKSDVEDELDVIFSSSSAKQSFFNSEQPQNLYEEKEALTDIVVPEVEYTKEDIELESFPTKYIKQTIRSGQVINYDGNIVIIGDCHPGCEITAFGDITVWGVLSGIAHAGAGGNQKAKVRALKMNAIQLRIANCYSRRPDSLNTVYIEKTNSFTPEEARIVNGEIVVFKMND